MLFRFALLGCLTCLALGAESQLTFAPHGHILTNTAAWSPDGEWLAYDVRPRPEDFVGDRIERVRLRDGAIETIYQTPPGSACGVVTWHPTQARVVFIHGPENPDESWSYGPSRRRGVLVDLEATSDSEPRVRPLDAMDYAAPFTPGALRGGSHVHVFSADGEMVSFTYDDEILSRPVLASMPGSEPPEPNQRNIGVAFRVATPVRTDRDHPRNHDGDWFSVLVTRTVVRPRPGSDEISRAFEDAWIGRAGYLKADGTRQPRALAFQGRVTAADGREHDEVFIVDLPADLALPGPHGPLEGTLTRRPAPPAGVEQRRLTFTDRDPPALRGIQGPRHWLRSSPDGASIAFLRRDEAGVTQLWLVSPRCDAPARQLTRLTQAPGIGSAFTWSPDGRALAAVINDQVCLIDAHDGSFLSLTEARSTDEKPLDLACVFSPDGRFIAFHRQVAPDNKDRDVRHIQVFVTEVPPQP